MELKEVTCANCHNTLLIQEQHVREPMFCTIGCMRSFKEDRSMHYRRN